MIMVFDVPDFMLPRAKMAGWQHLAVRVDECRRSARIASGKGSLVTVPHP
ncbi:MULTISPECIES: hypothetical protein [unclassified Novosphingobium]|nr:MULTISPECIES: hypothetical protein [unclassified Novosphingobium]